jgi:hypothetical protein
VGNHLLSPWYFYLLFDVRTYLTNNKGDFTPVCTTELGEVARRAPDFAKRGVKYVLLVPAF